MTSTSNKTNRMATKKYFMAMGWRALPWVSIPLVKFSNLSAVLRFGPTHEEIPIIVATKPAAKINWIAIGK